METKKHHPDLILMDLAMPTVSFSVKAIAGEPAKLMTDASTAAKMIRLLVLIMSVSRSVFPCKPDIVLGQAAVAVKPIIRVLYR